ncbi:DUF6427 family protein [Flavobacteriaceae bacterium TK19130]|nr:DUF6427 family protein [Thermobacterium salinum]
MLANFFEKSKPIHFIFLGAFLIVGYFFAAIPLQSAWFTIGNIPQYLLAIGLCVFMVLVLDFIIRKNHLTFSNSYAIFLFCCFVTAVPAIFNSNRILFSVLFLLLAFRRMISVFSGKDVKKKLFDTALWISVASLFHFGAILFMILLFFKIIRSPFTTAKDYFIPFIGFFSIFMMATAWYALAEDRLLWFLQWPEAVGFNFSAYNDSSLLIPAAVLLGLLIWTGIRYVFVIANVSKKEKPNAFMMLGGLVIALATAMAAPEKTGAELFFTMPFLAVISANYIERIPEGFIREAIVWLLLLMPITVWWL